MISLRTRYLFALSLLTLSCTTRPMLRATARAAASITSTRAITCAGCRSFASKKPEIIIDSIEHVETEGECPKKTLTQHLSDTQATPCSSHNIDTQLKKAIASGDLNSIHQLLSASSDPAKSARLIYDDAREKYITYKAILDELYTIIYRKKIFPSKK